MMRQGRVQRFAYGLCMALAALIAAGVLLYGAIFPLPDRYTAARAASTVPPMRVFAADSVFNTGDAAALVALPGVGEVIAQRIIELRELVRGYRIPEDLLLVQGVGPKTLDKLMNALTEPLQIVDFERHGGGHESSLDHTQQGRSLRRCMHLLP